MIRIQWYDDQYPDINHFGKMGVVSDRAVAGKDDGGSGAGLVDRSSSRMRTIDPALELKLPAKSQ